MENINEFLHNAEVAFLNKQYNEALKWYKKVLIENSDDIYSISKAGSICVVLERFEEALAYFECAKALDPENGDNTFNYGNACFFNRNNKKAFESYVEAEKLGCSKDVIPRLYYQMALLCSMRQDINSALIYFKKCEDADESGIISLNPDLISEKMKLYMTIQDYTNAARSAAQLVAIQPSVFRNYMVYYSMLMAKKDFVTAEKVLNDAQVYAETTPDDKITILLQIATLYVAKAENSTDKKENYFEQAVSLLEEEINTAEMSSEQLINVVQTLSEVYLKSGQYTKSVKCSKYLLKDSEPEEVNIEIGPEPVSSELTPDEIESMVDDDLELIREKIDSGELDEEILYTDIDYDEEGHPVLQYDDGILKMLDNFNPMNTSGKKEEKKEIKLDISPEAKERVYFTLLSAYLAMDDYKSAEKYAAILKHSENKYYNYYGIYTSAVIARKLNVNHALLEKQYAEAIAFFRSKSFADHSDTLAVNFRSRLYAEQGKYDKAKELALLLPESDRDLLLKYIKECRA